MTTLLRGLLLVAALLGLPVHAAQTAEQPKVLRYAFGVAETTFDPAKINDLYSRIVASHIFESLVDYDYLARPYKIVPGTTATLPEASEDFKVWTVRIKPGIYFADDPAFKGGGRRELVARDYAYSFMRHFDPVNKSPAYAGYAEEGVLGMEERRRDVVEGKRPFDYDREVEGLRVVDRYTLQFRLAKPRPHFVETIADSSLLGAVAREVVEFYGDKVGDHPVGTGPFRLTQWRRSSQMVLERNPGYRERVFDAQPNADDAEGQAIARRLKGRRLPMVDRVEIAVIEERQPRWLSFLNRDFDVLWSVPLEFANLAAPGGRLAPNLARQGIQIYKIVNTDVIEYYFNMDDPVVGGYTPDKVALRRAIGLAIDVGAEIRQVRRGQAIPAQSMVSPGRFGYDPAYKSVNSDYDPARAKALLDMFGYVDRDGDGWRDRPDGGPLVIEYATQPDSITRQFDALWQKNMSAIGIRLKFKAGQWPEQLKAARAGQLMVWQVGYTAAQPDPLENLQTVFGPAIGGQNLSRFRNARIDAIYREMGELPDGPQRLALLREAQAIVSAYAPKKYTVHRIITDLAQPWVIGFRRPLYGRQWWHYVDIDPAKRPVP